MTTQNTKNQHKIAVYFIPGMAANTHIFERIQLDESQYEPIFLEWTEPQKDESLVAYSQRMSRQITKPNPIIIGVSFGGVVAQEIARCIEVQQIIIISSVKNSSELPAYFRWIKKIAIYRIFPNSITWKTLEWYAKITPNQKIKNRISAYDKYLTVRSNNYLRWCLKELSKWDNPHELKNIVHIHGKKDNIFPFSLIKNAIIVENADHALVLTKANWLNNELQKILKKQ